MKQIAYYFFLKKKKPIDGEILSGFELGLRYMLYHCLINEGCIKQKQSSNKSFEYPFAAFT